MNSFLIVIGGFIYGVKFIELIAVFAVVVNSGVYIKLYFIIKIEDKNGIIIFERIFYKRRVMDEKNVYIFINML